MSRERLLSTVHPLKQCEHYALKSSNVGEGISRACRFEADNIPKKVHL